MYVISSTPPNTHTRSHRAHLHKNWSWFDCCSSGYRKCRSSVFHNAMLLLRSCYNHTTFSSRSGHDLTMPIELLIRQYYDCNKVFPRFHHDYTMQKLLPRSYMYHNLSTFPLRFIENHILLINRCSPFTRLLETSIPWQKKNTYHQNRQNVVHCGRGRSRGMGHHLIT